MKKLLLIASFTIAAPAWGQYPSAYNAPGAPIYGQPVLVAPLQPQVALPPPPPPQNNPYGTGYSIVTRQEVDRDVTGEETITSYSTYRQNDAWGNPMRTLQEIVDDAYDLD